MPETIDGLSMNLEQTNMDKLRAVFPECFAEGKLDIDKLLSLCGEYIDNDFEKYKVSDQVVNRLRTEIIQLKAHIHVNWNDTIEKDYISRRKREYIVEINS